MNDYFDQIVQINIKTKKERTSVPFTSPSVLFSPS
jgi:hypothetical protein